MRFYNHGPAKAGTSPFDLDASRAAYQKHVDLVAPSLPSSLLSLARGHVNLQDASVRLCTLEEAKDQMRLLVHLHAGDAEQTVELVYDGVDAEALEQDTLFVCVTEPEAEILYDEVDALDNGAYAHRLLFGPTPERELEVRFTRFSMRPGPTPVPVVDAKDRLVRR